jgi:hypothetical protein
MMPRTKTVLPLVFELESRQQKYDVLEMLVVVGWHCAVIVGFHRMLGLQMVTQEVE